MTQDAFPTEFMALQRNPLSVARAAAAVGQRVVGYVGNDIPVALIVAAGALPVRLRAHPGLATPQADSIVETSFATEHRILVEHWLRGELDFLDAAIFPRSDDSAQRLYYYMCEAQRRGLCAGPRPLLFDVADIARESSRDYTRQATCRLADELGARENLLESGLQRVARRTELLRQLRARRSLPSPLAGSSAAALECASSQNWRADFDDRAHAWLTAAPVLKLPRRIALAGDAAFGTEIHISVEAAGGSVVLELTESSVFDELRESPAKSMRRDARWLADRALEYRADGVIFWLAEQNEALPWEVARQMNSLRAAGIPTLLLSRQSWQPGAAALAKLLQFVQERPGSAA